MILNMRRFLLAASLLGGMTSGAPAGTIFNLATGLDTANNLITTGGQFDAHWSVQPQGGGIAPAQTVYPNNPDWYGQWLTNGPNSDWIARDATNEFQGAPPYAFTRTFDLSGFDLSKVSINGSWGIDDNGILSLNGYVISSLIVIGGTQGVPSHWSALTAFSVAAGSRYLLPGLNTLSITMTAADQVDDAVRLEGLVTFGSPTPEPSGVVMLALGVGIVGAMRLGQLVRSQRGVAESPCAAAQADRRGRQLRGRDR
jgi:hypothetical protein